MNLITPPRLRERWRRANVQIDLRAADLQATAAWWRALVARHPLSFAIIGGGVGGLVLSALPLRAVPALLGTIMRSATFLTWLRPARNQAQ